MVITSTATTRSGVEAASIHATERPLGLNATWLVCANEAKAAGGSKAIGNAGSASDDSGETKKHPCMNAHEAAL